MKEPSEDKQTTWEDVVEFLQRERDVVYKTFGGVSPYAKGSSGTKTATELSMKEPSVETKIAEISREAIEQWANSSDYYDQDEITEDVKYTSDKILALFSTQQAQIQAEIDKAIKADREKLWEKIKSKQFDGATPSELWSDNAINTEPMVKLEDIESILEEK